VSAAGPDRILELKVENRSDRVWVFGYVRMVPLILFVGGIPIAVALGDVARAVPALFGPAYLVLFVLLPLFLNWLPALDPVDFVAFGGDRVRIKRLAGNRTWPLDRVERVEFSAPFGEDFDEAQRARRLVWVTIRVRRTWPDPRLLVSDAAARRIADWADRRGISVAGTRT
jgi:hypothetical protein